MLKTNCIVLPMNMSELSHYWYFIILYNKHKQFLTHALCHYSTVSSNLQCVLNLVEKYSSVKKLLSDENFLSEVKFLSVKNCHLTNLPD